MRLAPPCAARLDDDEKADVGITDTSSNGVEQRRNLTIINESGLYSLILTSRKPAAKRFIEGEDCFVRNTDEARQMGITAD